VKNRKNPNESNLRIFYFLLAACSAVRRKGIAQSCAGGAAEASHRMAMASHRKVTASHRDTQAMQQRCHTNLRIESCRWCSRSIAQNGDGVT